jgi:aspartate/methionine/tyrosine aminotransferase
VNPVFAGLKTTVFEEMSGLARAHDAINLGQGFPDDDGPEDVRRAAAEAIMGGPSQYPPMRGRPELRSAIAEHYARFQGLEIDPEREVVVTAGATEALAAAILSLVGPGDEVVAFQPIYDSYPPMVRLAGGRLKLVALAPPDWRLEPEALEAAIGPDTRVVILNTPLNPGAVAYDATALATLANLCIRHDVTLICDEVWEHLVFDGLKHLSPITLAGMRQRTVKIGSAGKIFSMTGWKVGWTIAAPPLTDAIARAHQFLTFTVAPATQAAAAYGLGKDAAYFDEMRTGYARSRDRLAAGLTAEGFAVLPSQATYFLNLDLAASGIATDDRTFCLRAVKEAGIAAIPVSAFYEQDAVTSVVRLCFAKRDETLDRGIERLAKARKLFQ